MSHIDGSDDGEGYGVSGKSNGIGVYGEGDFANGVYGESQTGTAVVGVSNDHYGVVGGSSNSAGLYGESTNDYAALLNGKVKITGNLEKAGRLI